MVRPRLVEEGVPISQDDSDHEMEAEATLTPPRQHRPLEHSAFSMPHAPHETSLSRAAGSVLPQRRKSASYKYVIGGDQMHTDREIDAEQSLGHAASSSMAHLLEHSTGHASSHAEFHAGDHHQDRHKGHHRFSHHPHPKKSAHQLHFEIGADYRETERMEGVEDLSEKRPLIVMDGANIAYLYAQALGGRPSVRPQPDARGIRVAYDYFSNAGLRVLIVLPATWFHRKPRANDLTRSNALMQTDHLEVLQDLQQSGQVLMAPPTDDDDAYALTIAQRENLRALKRNGQGAGYVLSNDLFRDAQERDLSGQLRNWVQEGNGQEFGPGRISYAFCDTGNIDNHGDRELEIVPNPRHPLVVWIEQNLHHHI